MLFQAKWVMMQSFFLKASHFDFVAMNLRIRYTRYTSKRLLLSTYLLLCTAVVVETFAFLGSQFCFGRGGLLAAARRAARREAFTPCWSTALNAGWTFFAIAWYFFQKGKCYLKLEFFCFFIGPKIAGIFFWCLWKFVVEAFCFDQALLKPTDQRRFVPRNCFFQKERHK